METWPRFGYKFNTSRQPITHTLYTHYQRKLGLFLKIFVVALMVNLHGKFQDKKKVFNKTPIDCNKQ